MRLVDARRLTGPSHLGRHPLVLAEVALDDGEDERAVVDAYAAELSRMRAALGLPGHAALQVRPHRGGLAIAYAEPLDSMLVAAETSEWALESAALRATTGTASPLEPKLAFLVELLATTKNPALRTLHLEAQRRGIPFLWDDELVSLGMGARSVTFPIGALPESHSVDWSALGTVPVALVTGTNGKTTSSRWLARMALESGLRVALASTDGIAVAGQVLEDGDWTGPSAARLALRRSDVELAVLETARGGILRRGLAVEWCDVALITNVSDDHLGLSGIDDVAAMTEVKAVTAYAVRPSGTAVLNANDPHLVALADRLTCGVSFFADRDGTTDPRARGQLDATLDAALTLGRRIVVADGGVLVVATGAQRHPLLSVDRIPITFGGLARYNVENALGAVAAALALGLSEPAIVRALEGFAMSDNPGRGQVLDHHGVTIVLDFAHNAEGVRAVLGLVTALRNGAEHRLTVVAASPGDRTNEEIVAFARVIFEAHPDQVFVRDLPDYLRGRAPLEVPALFEETLRALGLPSTAFAIVESEVDALQRALVSARPGDVVAVLVHIELDAVAELLGRS